MVNNYLRHDNILMSLLMVGAATLTGCSTGLFKPVQPWYTSQNVGQVAGNQVGVPQLEIQEQIQQPYESTANQSSNNRQTAPQQPQSRNQPDLLLKAEPIQNAGPPISNASPVNRFANVPIRTDGQASTRSTYQPAAVSDGVSSQPVFRESNSLNANSNQTLFQNHPVSNQNGLSTRQTAPLFLGSENPATETDSNTSYYRFQSPQEAIRIPSSDNTNGVVRQTAAQFPELQNGNVQASPFLVPTIDTGSPNEINPIVPPNAPGGSVTFPLNYADLDIYVSETSTGRINFGGAYNSDSGLVGQFVIDERNFDILRLPTSFRDIVDGTAWRGAGQNFRLELVPGSDVERYLVSFSEPFLFGSRISFSTSLYYFQRQFFDYDEERLGGRFAFGYRLTPDISVSTGIRLENVEISDPRNATSPTLNASVGDTDLYVGNVSLVRDTRDHPFLPTEGNYVSLTYSQGFGEFDYSRGDIDFRTYRLMYQRPDSSGRHTLSYGTRLGFSGSQTPIFENYFAGGFSTLRGFDFRGASPIEGDIRVGGEFQWLNTVEYTFPLTADDMVKGVLFTDFGTVEENIEIDSDNFRVAPGFGFRVHLPAAGIGAPLAFDFAFPVSEAAGDDEEVFSFYLGVSR